MKSRVMPTRIRTDSVTAPIEDIRELLTRGKRILVATHLDPDGDAIGTQLAFGAYFRDLGKDVVLLHDSTIPDKYRFLSGVEDILAVDEFKGTNEFDTLLVLECPSLKRLGRIAELIGENTVIVNIDHHQNSDPLGTVNWIDNRSSSVGEMACEYFRAVSYKPSPEVAEQLYTAILTDTGRFRYDSTSPRTMLLAGELIGYGADPQKICTSVYYDIRPSTMKLIGQVLSGIEYHDEGRICLLTLTHKMLKDTGADESAVEGLVDHTMYGQGVIVGALLKERDEGCTRVSLRANNGIDVAQIAREFGGGGHLRASGCNLPHALDEARQVVLRLLSEAIDEEEA